MNKSGVSSSPGTLFGAGFLAALSVLFLAGFQGANIASNSNYWFIAAGVGGAAFVADSFWPKLNNALY